MSAAEWALLGFLGFAATWGMTAAVRRHALANNVLDIPNERSSHAVPTPRGGGIGFASILLLSFAYVALRTPELRSVVYAFWPALALVAILGYADDRFHLRAGVRLAVHFIAAMWILVMLGGVPPLGYVWTPVGLQFLGLIVGSVSIVWMLNLYNFMDGIDGIAAVQAIGACVGASVVAIVNGHTLLSTPELVALPLIVAASVAGFLVLNFPPAKIFMGDAGSGFLGLFLGAMAFVAAWIQASMLWVWLILLAVFIVDATWTLLRRIVRGAPPHQAHRSHAYQRAARMVGSHKKVTLCVAAILLVWLVPLAVLVGTGRLEPLVGTAIAYTPLAWLVWHLDAGSDS